MDARLPPDILGETSPLSAAVRQDNAGAPETSTDTTAHGDLARAA